MNFKQCYYIAQKSKVFLISLNRPCCFLVFVVSGEELYSSAGSGITLTK